MVTQMGAYFFFASGVPFLGSAMAAPAPPMAATAAAAAASITARRPSAGAPSAAAASLAGSCCWQRSTLAALATARLPRREGAAAAAMAAKEDAIMVSDAIGSELRCCFCWWNADVDGSCCVGRFWRRACIVIKLRSGREGGALSRVGVSRPLRRRHVAGRRDVAEGRARILDYARRAREDNERADRMTQPEFGALYL
jgi:hypothetical protein